MGMDQEPFIYLPQHFCLVGLVVLIDIFFLTALLNFQDLFAFMLCYHTELKLFEKLKKYINGKMFHTCYYEEPNGSRRTLFPQ